MRWVALLVGLCACRQILGIDGASDVSPERLAADRAWREGAQPILASNCAPCHGGSRPAIAYLDGDDADAQRASLLGYEPAVVDTLAPSSSRILSKGSHAGPPLTAVQIETIRDWIQKEKNAGVEVGPVDIKTEPQRVLLCTGGLPGSPTCPSNSIQLDDVGIPRGTIQFTAQALGSGLYFSNLRLVPGSVGAHIDHPLFVAFPVSGEPKPDPIDRYFNLRMNIQGASTPDQQLIGGGTAAFTTWLGSDEISVYFKDAGPYQTGGPPPPPTGCKRLTELKAARAQFTAAVGGASSYCAACHAGQNTTATSAMNMSTISSLDDAQVQLACNAILAHVNLTTPQSSGIYLAPDPGSAHPFQFTATQLASFKSGTSGWITAEMMAP